MSNTMIREALDILDARPNSGAIHRGLRLTLGYALEDHESPDPDWQCPGGAECHAEETARQIVAGEL